MASTPLAQPDDVADVWRPLTSAEEDRVANLIDKASAKLRQKCPFDIDERMALFGTTPDAPTALDPTVVADVVANIVKRFLVNTDGYASKSETVGPYARSGTFVNRYDKTGSDVRGAIQVIDSDIEQLRPAVPGITPFAFKVGVPRPELLIPGGSRRGGRFGVSAAPAVIPDLAPGSGVE